MQLDWCLWADDGPMRILMMWWSPWCLLMVMMEMEPACWWCSPWMMWLEPIGPVDAYGDGSCDMVSWRWLWRSFGDAWWWSFDVTWWWWALLVMRIPYPFLASSFLTLSKPCAIPYPFASSSPYLLYPCASSFHPYKPLLNPKWYTLYPFLLIMLPFYISPIYSYP